jgi:hypothetical protein
VKVVLGLLTIANIQIVSIEEYMKKLFNIGLVLCALFCVLLVGASFALKAYLSDARLRSMIVPPMEKALGRTVDIGQINVSLFSGVQVYDFSIKEANGADDFISSSRFVIFYNLLPLIQGKFVISEIRFVDPSIHVFRDYDGVFNFQSLVVLTKKKKAAEQEKSEPVAATAQSSLPFSVEIENFVIENGMVSVRDELGMLPETNVITNSEIHLGVGHNVTDYYYNGEIRFIIDTLYKGVELHNEGRVGFDETRCDYSADILLDKQGLQITGSVADYKAGGIPPLIFNLYSEELNVDRLLQSLANLSQKSEDKKAQPSEAVAEKKPEFAGVPPELNVHGEIQFNKVKMKGLLVEDFKLQYGLEKSVFTITDLKGRTLGGEIRGEVAADLQAEPSYEGKFAGHEFQLGEIQKTYIAYSPATMTGGVSGAISFKGSGIDPEVIKQRLSATGEYSLHDGMISGSDVTRSLAALLNMRELQDLPITKMGGHFEIKKGKLHFNASTNSAYFDGKSAGMIGLNGAIHVPVTMMLSPRLSQQLERRLEAAQYMEKENGRTIVHFMVDGSVTKPKVKLDVAKTGTKAAGKAIDELVKDGSEDEKAAGEAVKSVLDELFGQ